MAKIFPKRHLASMTIRHQTSWAEKLTWLGVGLVVVLMLAWGAYDVGRTGVPGSRQDRERVQELQKKLDTLTSEHELLLREANTAESKTNIDKSMQKELADQVKSLTVENQKLKDDLAFFESLIPSNLGGDGIAVQNLKLEASAPGQARYRALVMQGVKSGREFSGEIQFSLNLVQNGKAVTMLYPDPKSGEAGKLKLLFKHYQRLDGVISLPEGASLKSAQLRVLDKGVQRAQQMANL